MDPNRYASPAAIDPLPTGSIVNGLWQTLVVSLLTPLPALGGIAGFLLGLAAWRAFFWILGSPVNSLSPLGAVLALLTASVCGLASAILAIKAGFWLLDRDESLDL